MIKKYLSSEFFECRKLYNPTLKEIIEVLKNEKPKKLKIFDISKEMRMKIEYILEKSKINTLISFS